MNKIYNYYTCTVHNLLVFTINKMNLTYKQGRIVVILKGRFAGCKAVIINSQNESIIKNTSNFENVFLLGIQKHPYKFIKKMDEIKKIQRNKMKIFLKSLNKNHFLPTRYNIEFGEENNEKIRSFVTNLLQNKKEKNQSFENFIHKKELNLLKNILLDRYLSNKNKWFFKKLRF